MWNYFVKKTVRMSTEFRRQAEDWFIYANNVSKCLKIRQIMSDTRQRKLSYRLQMTRCIHANAMAWWLTWNHVPPHMCYHAEFGRSALMGEGTNIWEPTTLGALKFHSIEMGGVDDPKIHAPPSEDCSVTTSNLVLLLQRCLRKCLDWQMHSLA